MKQRNENKKRLQEHAISTRYPKYLKRFQVQLTDLDRKQIKNEYKRKKKWLFKKHPALAKRLLKKLPLKETWVIDSGHALQSLSINEKSCFEDCTNAPNQKIILKGGLNSNFQVAQFLTHKKKISSFSKQLLFVMRKAKTRIKKMFILGNHRNEGTYLVYFAGIQGELHKDDLSYGKKRLITSIQILKKKKFCHQNKAKVNWTEVLKLDTFFLFFKLCSFTYLRFNTLVLSEIQQQQKRFRKRQQKKRKFCWIFRINKIYTLKSKVKQLKK